MRLRYVLSQLLRPFIRRDREIRPSIEEMNKAREVISKISRNKEMDIVEKVAKFKSMIEGQKDGKREK
ncbi:MAG: hypothetical protein QXX16_02695 [Nitrososphaerota archaeon]